MAKLQMEDNAKGDMKLFDKLTQKSLAEHPIAVQQRLAESAWIGYNTMRRVSTAYSRTFTGGPSNYSIKFNP